MDLKVNENFQTIVKQDQKKLLILISEKLEKLLESHEFLKLEKGLKHFDELLAIIQSSSLESSFNLEELNLKIKDLKEIKKKILDCIINIWEKMEINEST